MEDLQKLKEENAALVKSLDDEKKRISIIEQQLRRFNENGSAKLFYSLNRKMVEMADIMNANTLSDLPLDDPKSKTFDRLKTIWSDAADIATAVKALGEIAGVTGDEKSDVSRRPFVDTIAQTRK